jgi:hypothetical protein
MKSPSFKMNFVAIHANWVITDKEKISLWMETREGGREVLQEGLERAVNSKGPLNAGEGTSLSC